MELSKMKFKCPTCGRVYNNPGPYALKWQKDKNEDQKYIICPIDKSFVYPTPKQNPAAAYIGRAIIGKAIIGATDE